MARPAAVCPWCEATLRAWAAVCPVCGWDLRATLEQVRAWAAEQR